MHTKCQFIYTEPSSDISVLPRKGDAILWNNEDEEHRVLEAAVHEAVAPVGASAGASVLKYAMNVWVNKSPIAKINAEAYRTT
jgi:hypothetical protein